MENVTVDSFIVSATPYDEVRPYYDDGTWSREKFAQCHILFRDQGIEYIPALLIPR